jgi:uncharacterized membrane protein HdeD (DUF308 family)
MAARSDKQKKTEHAIDKWPFGPKNYAIFATGIISIILGYIFLSKGSITLAPILLVLGYCVIIPVAIMLK